MDFQALTGRLVMANKSHEMLTFPAVEGHAKCCLPHDMAMNYFMGVSVLFHRIVPAVGHVAVHTKYSMTS